MANNRRVGRECALKMLFAHKIDVDQSACEALFENFWASFRFANDALGEPVEADQGPLATASRLFAETLVRGVLQYRSQIDQQIAAVAQNWSVERMTAVDLSILRLAVYELLYQPDIPATVTMNEAIEIAKRYGTKESPSFINGLLDKISRNQAAS